MSKIFYLFTFFIISLNVIVQGQTYDHNTGSLQVTVYQNGYLGHDAVPTGNGILFNSNVDACFTAGIMYGNSTNGVVGMVGSFTDVVGNPPLVEDCVNLIPITSGPVPNFNQASTCQFNDSNAPVPYGFDVTQESFSNTGDDFIFLKYTFENNTSNNFDNIYVGFFNDWDVGAAAYLNNRGGIDPARNLVYQWLEGGSPDPSYYGLIAFSGMSGGTASYDFPGDNATIRDTLLSWISSIRTPNVIVEDYRSFIGSGPFTLPPSSTFVVGFGIVAGENLSDLEVNTDAAQLIWDNTVIPVELTSFTANVNDLGQVILNWATATETNNQGFEIERRTETSEYRTIGYVEGFGTTTEPKNYNYLDQTVEQGINYYRLKQVDFDGTFSYSDEVEVDVTGPLAFNLQQNYPNPFNPSTNIKYSIAESGIVRLSIYNLVGEEVAILVNGYKQAGFYETTFDASKLPSGTYIYKLQSDKSFLTKKMMLLK